MRGSLKNLSTEQVLALNDEVLNKAVLVPKVPKLAYRVFAFLQSNQNLITTIGSMEVRVTGLDKYKLSMIAKDYGLDFSKWHYAVNLFESLLLKAYNSKAD